MYHQVFSALDKAYTNFRGSFLRTLIAPLIDIQKYIKDLVLSLRVWRMVTGRYETGKVGMKPT